MDYFYIENNSQKGPVSPEELARIAKPDTRVWCPGMNDWTPASEVAELAALMGGGTGSGFVMEGNPSQPTSGYAEPAQPANSGINSTDSYYGGAVSNQGGASANPYSNNNAYSGSNNGGYVAQNNGGYAGGNYQEKPQSYLVLAIIVCLLCCQPLGIPAIIYAARVESYWKGGFYDEARKASDDAKKFSFIALGLGVVFYVAYIIIMAMGAANGL